MEYLYFQILIAVPYVIVSLSDESYGLSEFYTTSIGLALIAASSFALLLLLVPGFTLLVRRLHDSGKSGWFALLTLIPFYGLYLICRVRQENENKYGVPQAMDYYNLRKQRDKYSTNDAQDEIIEDEIDGDSSYYSEYLAESIESEDGDNDYIATNQGPSTAKIVGLLIGIPLLLVFIYLISTWVTGILNGVDLAMHTGDSNYYTVVESITDYPIA